MEASERLIGSSYINVSIIINQVSFFFFYPSKVDQSYFQKINATCLFMCYIALVCHSLYNYLCISLNYLILMLIINDHSNLFKILI